MNEEKKVAHHTNERHSHSKVPSPNSRTQVPQNRPSGQMVGRRSPHSTKRKEENLTTMNQVLIFIFLQFSHSVIVFLTLMYTILGAEISGCYPNPI